MVGFQSFNGGHFIGFGSLLPAAAKSAKLEPFPAMGIHSMSMPA
jgi:hypothetical protein